MNEQAEKPAEWFGLNEREVNWVRTAVAGNGEDGYSGALPGIDEEGWFPIRVRASPYETVVIGNDVPGDTRDDSSVTSTAADRTSPISQVEGESTTDD